MLFLSPLILAGKGVYVSVIFLLINGGKMWRYKYAEAC